MLRKSIIYLMCVLGVLSCAPQPTVIVGEKGDPGKDGEAGQNGLTGLDGKNGKRGKDGDNGADLLNPGWRLVPTYHSYTFGDGTEYHKLNPLKFFDGTEYCSLITLDGVLPIQKNSFCFPDNLNYCYSGSNGVPIGFDYYFSDSDCKVPLLTVTEFSIKNKNDPLQGKCDYIVDEDVTEVIVSKCNNFSYILYGSYGEINACNPNTNGDTIGICESKEYPTNHKFITVQYQYLDLKP